MRFLGHRTWIKTAAVSFFAGSLVLTGTGLTPYSVSFSDGGLQTAYAEQTDSKKESETDQGAAEKGSEASRTEENILSGSGAAETEKGAETEAETVQINWWICPAGGLSDEKNVQGLVDLYEAAFPGVDVAFRILDEESGAEEIRSVLGTDEAPDVVLAAPENIVTQWSAEGYMADLASLWDEDTQEQFRAEMRETAQNRDGEWYAVPMFRDIYSMAINYDMFEEAGVLQYMNEMVHSWKDSGFIDTVLRMHDYLDQNGAKSSVVGRIYCKDKTGQREFMSFVTNFFNRSIVDDYHTSYQVSSGSIRDVFGMFRRLEGKGIEFDAGIDGKDENEAFLNGDVFLTFNWNAARQKAAQEKAGFRIFPMMYPNSKNLPVLTGTVRSLGVVDTGTEKEKETAISFVRFLMNDAEAYKNMVTASECFPARKMIDGRHLSNFYTDDETMELYASFNEYYGDYYPVMELFDKFEEKWLEMVQKIAEGEKIKSAAVDLDTTLNTELEEEFNIVKIDTGDEE